MKSNVYRHILFINEHITILSIHLPTHIHTYTFVILYMYEEIVSDGKTEIPRASCILEMEVPIHAFLNLVVENSV